MAERVSAFTRVSLLIIGLLGLGELPVAASPIVVATTLADELRIAIPDPPIDYAGPVFFNFDITGLDAGERLQVHAGQLLGGGSGIVNLALHLVVGGVYVPIPAIGFGATP